MDFANAERGLRIIQILEFINMSMYNSGSIVKQEISNE